MPGGREASDALGELLLEHLPEDREHRRLPTSRGNNEYTVRTHGAGLAPRAQLAQGMKGGIITWMPLVRRRVPRPRVRRPKTPSLAMTCCAASV
tara:strand:- start:331 stop:612 length:282 start_codon:yes stop_codon:yes gene_type:complete